jgi:hypothetical protein
MHQRTVWSCLLVSACLWSATAAAQDAGSPGTAVAALDVARGDDGAQDGGSPVAGTAAPTPTPGGWSRMISWASSRMDGGASAPDGFYPEFGGSISGGGISAGPGYRRHFSNGSVLFDASAARSLYGYSLLQSKIEWPRLDDDHLSLGAQIKYQDFTRINFFGIGNSSLQSDQTDYRLKYVDIVGLATFHSGRSFSISGRGGLMRGAGVSSGTSSLYPSIETRFNEGSAPGLDAQPNYLHADVSLDLDTRDVPGYPSSGGRYRASLAAFQDRDFGRYSFRRFEAEAIRYMPVTDWSVISVRGRMDLSQTGAGQQVPFYMLPALGNGQSLRGYGDYRFRDRDLTLVNAEYRLRVARPIDLAMFYDAGTVAPAAIDVLAMRHLKTDYGVGLRIHSGRKMIVRLDVARGREGTQAIVAITPSLNFTRQTVAPYVP